MLDKKRKSWILITKCCSKDYVKIDFGMPEVKVKYVSGILTATETIHMRCQTIRVE